jgi:hypothetical protein
MPNQPAMLCTTVVQYSYPYPLSTPDSKAIATYLNICFSDWPTIKTDPGGREKKKKNSASQKMDSHA